MRTDRAPPTNTDKRHLKPINVAGQSFESDSKGSELILRRQLLADPIVNAVIRTNAALQIATLSPDISSGTRDLRGCMREPGCARGAQPMPAGIGEHLSATWPRRRRANPRSPDGPNWLWPMTGCRCSFQRKIVGARGRPGETSGLGPVNAGLAHAPARRVSLAVLKCAPALVVALP
jgi:hypothetical protein